MILNAAQRGDALTLLQSLPDCCRPLVFFDPQHRAVLDRLKFGNEGARQRGRYRLPQMTEGYIDNCCREIARVLVPSGYCMRWIDTFGLCEGLYLHVADVLKPVDLIAWDSLRPGMGKRTRRRGDYLLILQKFPVHARTWRDHGISSRWVEKVDRRLHPAYQANWTYPAIDRRDHGNGRSRRRPRRRLLCRDGAAHELGRNFVGCDLILPNDNAVRTAGFVTNRLVEEMQHEEAPAQ